MQNITPFYCFTVELSKNKDHCVKLACLYCNVHNSYIGNEPSNGNEYLYFTYFLK